MQCYSSWDTQSFFTFHYFLSTRKASESKMSNYCQTGFNTDGRLQTDSTSQYPRHLKLAGSKNDHQSNEYSASNAENHHQNRDYAVRVEGGQGCHLYNSAQARPNFVNRSVPRSIGRENHGANSAGQRGCSAVSSEGLHSHIAEEARLHWSPMEGCELLQLRRADVGWSDIAAHVNHDVKDCKKRWIFLNRFAASNTLPATGTLTQVPRGDVPATQASMATLERLGMTGERTSCSNTVMRGNKRKREVSRNSTVKVFKTRCEGGCHKKIITQRFDCVQTTDWIEDDQPE